jgi:hypothetical protein
VGHRPRGRLKRQDLIFDELASARDRSEKPAIGERSAIEILVDEIN